MKIAITGIRVGVHLDTTYSVFSSLKTSNTNLILNCSEDLVTFLLILLPYLLLFNFTLLRIKL